MQSYRNDDFTSKLAMERMIAEGRLSERRAQVMYLVTKYPGRTSAEYSRLMHKAFPELPIRSAVESPHKRLPELRELGFVRKAGIRKCLESGEESVFFWEPVPQQKKQ